MLYKTQICDVSNSEAEYISDILNLRLQEVGDDELQLQEVGEGQLLTLTVLLAKECYRLSNMIGELQLDLHAFTMRASKSDPHD